MTDDRPRIDVTCPVCGETRSVAATQVWRIETGFATGECQRCTNTGRRHVDRKNPGAIKLHDPLSRSLYKTRFYGVWANMRNRCENPNNRSFANYGGRGIAVCERWSSFENFVADMYRGYIEGSTTIERIDNDGPYSPENCKWVTRAAQTINTRHNVFLTHDGRCMTVSQWAVELNMNRRTIEQRIRKGWSAEQVLMTPVGPRRGR